MPTFNSSYLTSSFGFTGRVPFSSTAVAYIFPLLDSSKISVSNGVTGDTTNYNAPALPQFPILFQAVATAACRVRQRTIHPSVAAVGDTTSIFTRMTGSAGYTNVPAATDAIRYVTLPSANIGGGTNSLATRVFDTINTGTYGAYLPAGTVFPVMVSSYRDCWLQVIARDGAGAASTGEILFTCISDLKIVGY